MSDALDVIHALFIETIIADARADQQSALLVAVMGGKPPELPTIDERVASFLDSLDSEPEVVDETRQAVRRAIGLED